MVSKVPLEKKDYKNSLVSPEKKDTVSWTSNKVLILFQIFQSSELFKDYLTCFSESEIPEEEFKLQRISICNEDEYSSSEEVDV